MAPHSSLNGSKSEKTEKGLHSNTSLAPRGSRQHEVLEVWILIPNFMFQINKEGIRRSAFLYPTLLSFEGTGCLKPIEYWLKMVETSINILLIIVHLIYRKLNFEQLFHGMSVSNMNI